LNCRTIHITIAVLLLAWTPLQAQILINELLAFNRFTNLDEDGAPSDWIELYNAGATRQNLGGYFLTDDPLTPAKWVLPAKTLFPGDHALIWCSGKDRVGLVPDRLQDPVIPFFPNLVSLEAEWQYLLGTVGAIGPPEGWQRPGFDDSGWLTGKGGFGYREPGIVTEIPIDTATVFFRHNFTFEDQDLLSVVLQMQVDDGFVAYLNGTRVASLNFAEDEEPTFDSLSTGSNSGSTPVRFELSDRRDRLRVGEDNLLAIALVNRRVGTSGSDIFLSAQLGSLPFFMHSNFQLRQNGETVILRQPDGEIADQLSFPPQVGDQSFGRFPDGSLEPPVFQRFPTPLTANTEPVGLEPMVVAPIEFSVPSGFHDAPLEIELTSATQGAEIRYLRNGRAPSETLGTIYTRGIPVNGTTVLRAIAYKEGLDSTPIGTRTYLFLDKVIRQDRQSGQALGLPGGDYDMDQTVVNQHAGTIRDDLRSIPTVALGMESEDLFGTTGIYSRSMEHGIEWERPCSVEMIYPDGRKGFQVDAGIRVQGGASRDSNLSAKHSLRLLFKREYGPTRLEFPLFAGNAVGSYDQLILRAGFNDAWLWSVTRERASYIRDSFHRHTILEMGGAASHELWVHLYFNGVYWGLHNLVERPNAAFAASYFGGQKEDYDALSHRNIQANETTAAWDTLQAATSAGLETDEAYFAAQGKLPDGTDDPATEQLLDVDSMVQDLLAHFYTGAGDWPTNNFWVARRRGAESTGFKHFIWDTELSIDLLTTLDENRTGVSVGPARPYASARNNLEFQLRFADHVHRYLFNGGPLSVDLDHPAWDPENPQRNRPAARFAALAAQVRGPLVAESARWGDWGGTRITRDAFWEPEIAHVLRDFFPARHAILLDQLRVANLYPTVDAPTFDQHGGRVASGFVVTMSAPRGDFHYTLDGSDPRLLGGAVSPAARLYPPAEEESPIILQQTTTLRARALTSGVWSALNEAEFVVDDGSPLRITEIFYHPPDRHGVAPETAAALEFIELKNIGDGFVNLEGYRLSGGVEFDFSGARRTRLGPGERVVVVRDSTVFAGYYDVTNLNVAGAYTGELSNGGEHLILTDAQDNQMLAFTFNDQWYPLTDGHGHSLVVANEEASRELWNDASNWLAGRSAFGSPGSGEEVFRARGGGQRQGDSDQNGRINISDAIVLVLRLFTPNEEPLPCEGAHVDDGANRILFDIDGSNAVDPSDVLAMLHYLFGTESAPALGTGCVEIQGCPNVCS
jgi:hypothetical protein